MTFSSWSNDSNPNEPGQTGSSRKCALKNQALGINARAPAHHAQSVRTAVPDQGVDPSIIRQRESGKGGPTGNGNDSARAVLVAESAVWRRVADADLLAQARGMEKAEFRVAVVDQASRQSDGEIVVLEDHAGRLEILVTRILRGERAGRAA